MKARLEQEMTNRMLAEDRCDRAQKEVVEMREDLAGTRQALEVERAQHVADLRQESARLFKLAGGHQEDKV